MVAHSISQQGKKRFGLKHRLGRAALTLAGSGVLAIVLGGSASALDLDKVRSQEQLKKVLNANTVTLMSGCCTSGAYTNVAADIMGLVRRSKDKNGLRVLPMLGGGAGTNVRDLLFLRGIDMAIINTDTISAYEKKPLYRDMKKRLRYITKMFNEEVHLFTSVEISSVKALNGRRVGFTDSSAEITGSIIFKKLGIKPAKTMQLQAEDGAAMMKAGKLDAIMRVSGKPIGGVARLQQIYPAIKFLPITFGPEFIGSHLPTQLTHEDYPSLIGEGETVPTIATPTLLAVFNWKQRSDRYRRLAHFVDVFFARFSQLRASASRHPKWDEVNLQAKAPGLKRFTPAEIWLGKRFQKPKLKKEDLVQNFKKFLKTAKGRATGGAKAETEDLFRDFIRWQKRNK